MFGSVVVGTSRGVSVVSLPPPLRSLVTDLPHPSAVAGKRCSTPSNTVSSSSAVSVGNAVATTTRSAAAGKYESNDQDDNVDAYVIKVQSAT